MHQELVLVEISKADDFRCSLVTIPAQIPWAANPFSVVAATIVFQVAAYGTSPLEFEVCQASRRTRPQ